MADTSGLEGIDRLPAMFGFGRGAGLEWRPHEVGGVHALRGAFQRCQIREVAGDDLDTFAGQILSRVAGRIASQGAHTMPIAMKDLGDCTTLLAGRPSDQNTQFVGHWIYSVQ